MDERLPVRGRQLSEQIVEILLERIQGGLYPPGSQVPPENELAAEFDVSRSTVRSAMNVLAGRGLITRQQGVGTYVSQLSHIANPLNEAVDFNHLIARFGFKPGVQFVSAELVEAGSELAESLRIKPSEPVFKSLKIFTADDDPIIYVINAMPTWMFDRRVCHWQL